MTTVGPSDLENWRRWNDGVRATVGQRLFVVEPTCRQVTRSRRSSRYRWGAGNDRGATPTRHHRGARRCWSNSHLGRSTRGRDHEIAGLGPPRLRVRSPWAPYTSSTHPWVAEDGARVQGAIHLGRATVRECNADQRQCGEGSGGADSPL